MCQKQTFCAAVKNKLYRAAHQKLSRRIKDCRAILKGKVVDFSRENVASEL